MSFVALADVQVLRRGGAGSSHLDRAAHGPARCVAINPEDGAVLVGSADGVEEYDATSGARLGRLPYPWPGYEVQALAVSVTSGGGAYVAGVDAGGVLLVWSLDTRACTASRQLAAPPHASRHGGGHAGAGSTWSLAGSIGQPFPVLFASGLQRDGVAWSSTTVLALNLADPALADANVGGAVRDMINKATRKRLKMDGRAASIVALATHPSKPLVAVATADGAVSVWDVTKLCRTGPGGGGGGRGHGEGCGRCVQLIRVPHHTRLRGSAACVTALSFNPWHDILVTGTATGAVSVWRLMSTSMGRSVAAGNRHSASEAAVASDAESAFRIVAHVDTLAGRGSGSGAGGGGGGSLSTVVRGVFHASDDTCVALILLGDHSLAGTKCGRVEESKSGRVEERG